MLSNTNSMVGTEINCGHDELQIVIITEAVKKDSKSAHFGGLA